MSGDVQARRGKGGKQKNRSKREQVIIRNQIGARLEECRKQES